MSQQDEVAQQSQPLHDPPSQQSPQVQLSQEQLVQQAQHATTFGAAEAVGVVVPKRDDENGTASTRPARMVLSIVFPVVLVWEHSCKACSSERMGVR
jgi:hypothetical protein